MSNRRRKESDLQSMEETSTKVIKQILFEDDSKDSKKKDSKDEKSKNKSTKLITSPSTGSGPSEVRQKILAPPKEKADIVKPKMIQKMLAPLDATGEREKIIVKLNKDKKGLVDIEAKDDSEKARNKAVADENKKRRAREVLLEEKIMSLQAALEKAKDTGSHPITPKPVKESSDHTELGGFSQSQIDFMQTMFGNQLKLYHETNAAIEKLKLKKAISDVKSRKTTAAIKSTKVEKSRANSNLGVAMGSPLSDGEITDDEEMEGSKDDRDGDDSE